MTIDDLPRLRQDKTPAPHSVDAANPEAQRRARRYFAPSVQMFGRHPGYGGAIIGIEGRDHTLPSWSGFEEKAFKKFAGYPIPATIIGKTAPHFRTIADFPRTRIVADDYPLLVYYRWFWEQGDGYPTLNSLSADILRESGNKELWSFSDPAVRCPPKWGSGGSVDFLSQWTYCYPDPIKIAQATDELFAMAAGRPGQGVMKMTQAIWYREQTAPAKQTVTTPPAWATENPTTEFITIAPDLLKEAFWSKLSRPIAGIMYHGYGSLFNDIKITKESMYTMTNPESREVLKELVQTVVQPLGPTLKHLPARTSEVAILESFASTIFAGRGTWGWGRGWIADVHLMTQWAGLQPVIVYEETILRDRLVGIKVLVLPHCEVLPQAAFNAIRDFQRAGGILVGDEFTIPALLPNLRLASYTRTGDAVKDKAALQQMAAQFRQDLASVLTPYATSDNPDIVTYARAAGNADYIFAVNDKRTYGDYVGMYGLVMEKGLPNRGTVTVRRPAAAVYDPVRHQSVPFTVSDGVTAIPVEFTTSDGRLLMLTDAAVTAVKIAAIPEAGGVNVTVTVTDADGKPITADFPLEITVTAADGARLPASDYYRAANGVVHIAIPKFYQGAPFPWRIKAKDLASGLSGEQTVNGAE
ncbi:MAG: cadherin-like beta sandwich domain-containing protein [Lentisphaerae bacterium]|nr:cadherin-like beta sandwich domain-containing protein [Lentisphaerota bacterium]